MVILDIVLLLCFVPAVILGISKGFIKQLTELAALILGCLTSVKFTNMLGAWAQQYITIDSKLLYILCFILILIIVATVFTFLGNALTRLFKAISLGWVNRLLGLVFGVIKTALIMGLVIMVLDGINTSLGSPVKPKVTEDSVVYNSMKKMAQSAAPSLRALLSGTSNSTPSDQNNV